MIPKKTPWHIPISVKLQVYRFQLDKKELHCRYFLVILRIFSESFPLERLGGLFLILVSIQMLLKLLLTHSFPESM